MGVFDDKKFEELDWISQATEPIDSHLNEILGKLPEETLLDFKTIKKILSSASYYSCDLSIEKVMSYIIKESAIEHSYLSWKDKEVLRSCFKFQLDGSNEVIIDFEKQEVLGGELRLIKQISTLDEKVLENLLGNDGIEALGHMYFMGPGLARANEVMELLGKCDDGFKSRSDRRKRYVIIKRLKELFKTNEWKIKDTDLANKVGFWIKSYIVDGNLAAFSNFCRLKVMTHKEQPIYSMEEIK